MGLLDLIYNGIAKRVVNLLAPADDSGNARKRLYFEGYHDRQIKKKENSDYDDNIALNFTGLVCWRSISRTMRGGVNWQLPDGEDAQKQYLDDVYRANRKDRLFLQGEIHASVFGAGYFEIVPEAKQDWKTGKMFPRIIPLNPQQMTIQTDPHDIDDVESYTQEYPVTVTGADGRERVVDYRKVTRKAKEDEYTAEIQEQDGVRPVAWVVEYWKRDRLSANGKWALDEDVSPNPVPWPWPFPPIVHWKNLPSIGSAYGVSDIDDIANQDGPQDKANFAFSNTGKLIRLQAHKQLFTLGVPPPKKNPDGSFTNTITTGPDKVVNIPGKPGEALLDQLDATADIAGAMAFTANLRQVLFDLSREIDIASIVDKAGALTNFGLHVLYGDALDKTETKRQLYGEAIEELNHRLLVLAGNEGAAADPGKCVWGEPLPTNISEDMTADQQAIDMGIAAREAVYKRYQERYGMDWEAMKKLLDNEKAQASQQNDNLGAFVLRNFNRGGAGERGPVGMTRGQEMPANMRVAMQSQEAGQVAR